MSLDDGDSLRLSDKFAFFRGNNTDASSGRRDVPLSDLVTLLNDPSSGLVSGGASVADVARLEENIGLNSLRDAVSGGWSWFNMVDGVADAFTDQTGIDTGESTAGYNSAGNYYTSPTTDDLLVQPDSVNAATAFSDSGINAYTLVAAGDAQNIASPVGGSTVLNFNAITDGLTLADSADWDFGSGDFTIDFYIYLADAATSTTYDIMGQWGGSSNAWKIGTTGSSMDFFWTTDGTTTQSLATGTNQQKPRRFTHYAFVRSGGTLTIYVDGVSQASVANSDTFFNSTEVLRIGAGLPTAMPQGVFFSQIRILKGTAAWTSGFTPPTTPYSGGTEELLILSDTTDGSTTFVDSGTDGKTITPVSTVNHRDITKFGSSMMGFPTTASIITATGSGSLDVTGDFTIDCWAYVSRNEVQGIFMKEGSIAMGTATGGVVRVYYTHSSGTTVTLSSAAAAYVVNQMQHFAVVVNGTNIKMYVDGVAKIDATLAATIDSTANVFTIGDNLAASGTGLLIGEFRVLIGTAVWTTDFTPPTVPYAGAGADFDLQSIPFPTLATPTSGRLVVLYDPIDSVTINTDLIFECSRDGGTTWTAWTLEENADFSGTIEILTTDDLDISSQPVGSTSIIWRATTANTKDIQIHGVYLQWR